MGASHMQTQHIFHQESNLRIFGHCWVTPYLADYQNFKITTFESFFESSEMCDQWARKQHFCFPFQMTRLKRKNGVRKNDWTLRQYVNIREALLKKKCFLLGIARISAPPPSPQFGQLVPLILDVKNDVLARITEHSKT